MFSVQDQMMYDNHYNEYHHKCTNSLQKNYLKFQLFINQILNGKFRLQKY